MMIIKVMMFVNDCVTGRMMVIGKDYIEKIDFQALIFAVVNWPNSELYGAFVYLMHYLE